MSPRADALAIAAGFSTDAWVKVKENTKACTTTRAVYNVWLRLPGAKRGRWIASLVYWPRGAA